MASLFRKTVTRPLPKGATIELRERVPSAVWRDRAGRKRTAPLLLGANGEPVTGPDGTPRIREHSRTLYAKVPGMGNCVPTGCTTADAAGFKLAELVQRAEHLRAGILTGAQARTADFQTAPLAEHLGCYGEHLDAKGCTAAHCANVLGRLRRLARECEFTRLADLERTPLERWLVAQAAAGMGARTRNAYGAAAVSFGNWALQTHRVSANPFARLAKACEAADPRRQRRALSEAELVALLAAAALRPLADFGREAVAKPGAGKHADPRRRDTWQAAPLGPDTLAHAATEARKRLAENPAFVAELEYRGHERALLYKLLALTGLRLNEARSLRVGALALDGPNPYATLAAADAKTREGADVLLRLDLADDLRRHLASRLERAQADARAAGLAVPLRLPAEMAVLEVPRGLVKILERDMVAAGLARIVRDGRGKRRVAKRDERGRTFDVHGFRHTFNSLLARAGVSLRARQVLMRHRSGTLTDDVYSDAKLLDLRGALNQLPPLTLAGPDHAGRAVVTGTHGRPDAVSGPTFVAPSVAPNAGIAGLCLGIPDNSVRFTDSKSAARGTAVSADAASVRVCLSNAEHSGHESGRQALIVNHPAGGPPNAARRWHRRCPTRRCSRSAGGRGALRAPGNPDLARNLR